MRTQAIIRMISWTVVALMLVVLLTFGITGRLSFGNWGWSGRNNTTSSNGTGFFENINWNNGNNWVTSSFNYRNSELYSVGGGTIPAESLKSLEINWLEGSVLVEEYDGTEVRFYEESNVTLEEGEVMRYYLDPNGRLIIQYCEPKINYRFTSKMNKQLTVQVPVGIQLKDLELDGVSNSVELRSLTADNTDIDSISGRITIHNLTTDKLDIDTISGAIEANGVIADKVTVEAISASVKMTGDIGQYEGEAISGSTEIRPGTAIRSIDVESISGAVRIYLPENDGFKASWSSASGRFDTEFAVTTNGKTATYKTGGIRIDMQTVSGSMTVSKA